MGKIKENNLKDKLRLGRPILLIGDKKSEVSSLNYAKTKDALAYSPNPTKLIACEFDLYGTR